MCVCMREKCINTMNTCRDVQRENTVCTYPLYAIRMRLCVRMRSGASVCSTALFVNRVNALYLTVVRSLSKYFYSKLSIRSIESCSICKNITLLNMTMTKYKTVFCRLKWYIHVCFSTIT